MTLAEFLERQRDWSAATFGPGPRTEGLTKHIKKELLEIAEDPTDLMEWVDIVILAMDGFWRAGGTGPQLETLLDRKQRINTERSWPTGVGQSDAIQHLED